VYQEVFSNSNLKRKILIPDTTRHILWILCAVVGCGKLARYSGRISLTLTLSIHSRSCPSPLNLTLSIHSRHAGALVLHRRHPTPVLGWLAATGCSSPAVWAISPSSPVRSTLSLLLATLRPCPWFSYFSFMFSSSPPVSLQHVELS
jgi:hypothetical protein